MKRRKVIPPVLAGMLTLLVLPLFPRQRTNSTGCIDDGSTRLACVSAPVRCRFRYGRAASLCPLYLPFRYSQVRGAAGQIRAVVSIGFSRESPSSFPNRGLGFFPTVPYRLTYQRGRRRGESRRCHLQVPIQLGR